MQSVWNGLRSGDWMNGGRLRAYAVILIAAYLFGAAAWIGLSNGLIDPAGKPLGTDFSNVYAAGRLAHAGQAAAAYDWEREYDIEKAVFGRAVPFYGWHYPPQFLTVAAVLALMPYGAALAAWLVATLAAYAASLRAILPHRMTVPLALAFPAVFVNVGHGQNGFLSAALLGAALLVLDTRPLVAGVLIGLLAYKPQFGMLIPIVLIATARWRVVVSAAATVIATCVATVVLFGANVWSAFLASTSLTSHIVLEEGNTGWQKIQSLFSFVRMWGGGIEAAYAAQGALALAVAIALVALWRSAASADLKAAALASGSLLATPYVLDYDLTILAVAIAFYARHIITHGRRDFELSILAAIFISPLIARGVAFETGLPLGLAAQVAMFGMTIMRARAESNLPMRSHALVQA